MVERARRFTKFCARAALDTNGQGDRGLEIRMDEKDRLSAASQFEGRGHSLATVAEKKRPPASPSRNQSAHQRAITQGLKTFYEAVASEPVPDEFIALLQKMDEQ
jgi:hypothetical protein